MKKVLSFTLAILMIFSAPILVTAADQKTAWEFNKDGDNEGWVIDSAKGGVKDGAYSGTATERTGESAQKWGKYDAMITSPALSVPASDYKCITVGMKHELLDPAGELKIFYKTSGSPNLDETKTVKAPLKKSSDGKFTEYVFDMSDKPEWKGTVTVLRVDPINLGGSFSVDYIRLLKEVPKTASGGEQASADKDNQTQAGTGTQEKNRFPEVNKFSQDSFKDIGTGAWYFSSVSTAYKIGLMNGKTDKTFDPDGQITVAEAITLAVRVNEIYNGRTGKFANSNPWYQVYVDAAIKAGIITKGQFSDYNAAISRADMGNLFAKALPDEYFTPINKFTSIPDVADSSAYFKNILKLYNAGIVTGVDDAGNYNPNANIKRSEAAAIITRVAVKENRQKKLSAADKEEQKKQEKTKEEEAKKADEAKAAAERAERVKKTAIRFDFNDGKLGDFKTGNCEDGANVKDGFLNAKAKNTDPIISIPSAGMDLNKYQVIRVGMKWSGSGIASQLPAVFFITDTDENWNEAKRVDADKILGADSSDKVVEFTFICYKNSAWKGKAKQVRFDPYNSLGNFSVDYIVFEEK